MSTYNNGVFRRKNFRKNQAARSVKWHGPRFIRGRRSSRSTVVWTVRARRLSNEVLA
jgi:hypothetical protein